MFDAVLMIDWSGGNDRGPRPTRDAIWACRATSMGTDPPVYLRNRQIAEDWITRTIARDIANGLRVCAGFDFPLAFPQGFACALIGRDDPQGLWDWFAGRVVDGPNANNRFDLAGQINADFPGVGPFWGNGLSRDIAHLPRRGNERTFRWPHPRRATESAAKGSFEVWQLSGAGAVGGQAIMGMPLLARLCRRFAGQVVAWPFDPAGSRPLTLMEIWPSLIAPEIAAGTGMSEIRDAAQVRIMAGLIARLPGEAIHRLLDHPPSPEGWIFGVGHETELSRAALRLATDVSDHADQPWF
jgi:molybdopterin molybdotransferase